MKKFCIALVFLCVVFTSWAFDSNRIFEMGIDVGVGAANNYFTLNDFSQETLVIDFNDIVQKIANQGFRVSVDGDIDTFMSLNLSKKLQLRFFTDIDIYTYSATPASLFDLIASGNIPDKAYEDDFDLKGDVYVETGAQYSTMIGPVAASIRPVWFMPVVHMHNASVSYSFTTSSDGTLSTSGSADIPVYTVLPVDSLSEGVNPGEVISALFASGGLDFSVSAEYPLFPVLSVGARLVNVPFVPARMKYGSHYTASADFTLNGLGDNFDFGSLYTTTTDSDFETDMESVFVYRTFKIGAYADYSPFMSKLLVLTPNLALAIDDSVYADCGLKVQTNLINILMASLESQYEDRIWNQKITIGFNLRVFELDIFAATQSPGFIQSFTGSGFSAGIGLRFGY